MICNRKCKFFDRSTCKIMSQYEEYIDKCILEHEKIKKIEKGSLLVKRLKLLRKEQE